MDTQEWRRLLLSVDMSDLRWMAQGIVVNYETMDRMSLIEGMLANRDKLHNAWRAWEIWDSNDDDDAGVQLRAGDGTLVRTIHRRDFGFETRSEPIHIPYTDYGPVDQPARLPKESSGLEYWQGMYRSQLDIFLREA